MNRWSLLKMMKLSIGIKNEKPAEPKDAEPSVKISIYKGKLETIKSS